MRLLLLASVLAFSGCVQPDEDRAQWSALNQVRQGEAAELSPDSLASLTYADFFDEHASLDYHRLLAYRTLEDQIPEGAKRRAYYNVLALLEAYLGNAGAAIEITDQAALQPTTMMVFDSTGAMKEVPFVRETAYSAFPDSLIRAGYTSIPLDSLLSDVPADVRVFGLNEVHTVPRFRSTLYAALPALRRQGFDHLALETLYDEQDEFNAVPHPERAAGFFSSEAMMGDVVRRAKALGFTLVSYDAQGAGSQLDRELQSFQALVERTFEAQPDARVVLYAGHSHTWRTQIGAIPMLGKQLDDAGYPSLVIHQSGYFERNVPEWVQAPTLFRPNNPESPAERRYDYLLVLPRSIVEDGRPSWLWDLDRVPVAVREELLKRTSVPALVEAFPSAEPDTAVPLDRVELTSAEDKRSLALRPGEYRVRVTNAENEAWEGTLVVNAEGSETSTAEGQR
ncbi:MAG: hypothetical protein AAGI08_02745 [Bacteroidota bacterium]